MKQSKHAFTLVELLVVLGITVILAGMLLPALAATQSKSARIGCLNNLKQVGLAFQVWSDDTFNQYPMAVFKTSGGAHEFLAHAGFSAAPVEPFGGNSLCPGMAFMVMSNELFTPKVLFCPSDNIHTAGFGYATNFAYQDLLGVQIPSGGGSPTAQAGENIGAGSSKISYFVNADATAANPQDIMSGDDNIGNFSATTSNAFARFRFGASVSSSQQTGDANSGNTAGITAVAFNGSPWWSWTSNDFHLGAGNLSFADGSCQQAGVSGLHYYLNHSTNGGAEAINCMP